MRGRRGAEKLGRDEKTVEQRQARRVEWAETALAPEKGTHASGEDRRRPALPAGRHNSQLLKQPHPLAPCQDSELELYYVNSNRRREPCKDPPMPDFRGSWPR